MCKIMIIDDEQAVRSALRLVIEKECPGAAVAGEAASGIEAINTIDMIQADIAFVDIRMPFMDGIEFSKLAIKRYPDLKIVILTAVDEFESARRCIGTGICGYLLKPVSRQEIRTTVTSLMERVKSEKRAQCDEEGEYSVDAISNIKKYIEENYKDPDINLTSIAQKFGFNSSYLSRIFKKKTNTGLIDYLTGYRMDKAIELAKKGELMYMTACNVGIPDPNYFGKCFKKHVGVSYSEYMKCGE